MTSPTGYQIIAFIGILFSRGGEVIKCNSEIFFSPKKSLFLAYAFMLKITA